LRLIKKDYSDFGPQLIKEQLEERHALRFSREWIRAIMINEGLWKVKKRKNLHFYQRRKRRSREGEPIQAAESGVALSKIKNLSRHKSLSIIMLHMESVGGFEKCSVKVQCVTQN
jgi:hypothetical protein